MFANAMTRTRYPMANARWAALLLIVALLLPWGAVQAACRFSGTTPQVNFSVPSTISVPYDAQVGDVIYQTAQIAPAPVRTFDCTSGSTRYGVINRVGATPGITETIYPTSVAGVGYRLAHGDFTAASYMRPWACCQLAPGSYTFNVPTALQLVKTGPIANGAQLAGGRLAIWQHERTRNRLVSLQDFVLAGSVTFSAPACQVNTSNIAVVLPTISNTALPAVDSTAGGTAFRIGLTCSPGRTLSIMFTPGQAVAGKPAVIRSTGSATGVGVQLTDASLDPVSFTTPKPVGTTPSGGLDLLYHARYYRTGAVSAGTVTATATFTLSYD